MQRSRKTKTSKGLNGGGGKGRPMTIVEKVLMGGGLYRDVEKRSLTAQKRKSPFSR